MNNDDRFLAQLAQLPHDPSFEAPIHAVAGGRVPEDGWIGVTSDKGAALGPREWLERHLIPLVEEQAGSAILNHGRSLAVFRHHPVSVVIPIGLDLDDPENGWTVWHEIGHAMDYVTLVNGVRQQSTSGKYSELRLATLREFMPVIIDWNFHPDREYKESPKELWAECVACAVMQPERMPMPLLYDIVNDLRERGIPLPNL